MNNLTKGEKKHIENFIEASLDYFSILCGLCYFNIFILLLWNYKLFKKFQQKFLFDQVGCIPNSSRLSLFFLYNFHCYSYLANTIKILIHFSLHVLNYSQSCFFKMYTSAVVLQPHPSPRSNDDGRRGGKREKSHKVGEMESRAAARPFKSDGDDRRRPATSAIRRGATARRTFCRRWLAFERTSAYNAITLALTVARPTGLAAKYITTTPSCVHAHAFPPCRANGARFSFLASVLPFLSIDNSNKMRGSVLWKNRRPIYLFIFLRRYFNIECWFAILHIISAIIKWMYIRL